ncbi:hypothetical protein NL676_031724 [Syzygium grande]|nr:hypothetical protein NL676_031724 [Syzygium grande]
MKTGRLSARAYRALFRKSGNKDKASDCREELSRPNKSFQQEHINSGAVDPEEVDAVDNCSDHSQKTQDGVESMTQIVEKQNEENTCLRQNSHFTQQDPNNDSGREENRSSLEKQSELMDFSRNGRSLDGRVCLEKGQEDVPDKQNNSVYLMSNASALAGCQNVTSAERNFVEIDGINSKRKSGEPEATVNLELGEKQNLHVLVNIDAESGQSTCCICKLGGKLLCCDGAGCQKYYHLSCLDPPLNDVPPGVWHCLACVRKMMKYDAYSVSEGVEFIWDCREAEELDPNGCQKQKEFFVKYKGLAHFHNLWLPEAEVAAQCPSLVASFLRTKQVVPWKSEWTLPRRLLQKRLITSPQFHSEHDRHEEGIDVSTCHYQWLVKWCGLDYEHASWELENASLFLSSEARSLFKQYENRLERATGACNVELIKPPERKKSLRNEILKLPAKVSPGPENNHADLIDQMFDSWKRSQINIIADDQEHISKVTSFILSLKCDGCLPFLIISPSTSVYSWDAEFFHRAPTVNVVVYNGSKDARRCIRKLEYFQEGAPIVFQVLISPPEAIVEDMDILTQIEWEALVVDECQQPRTLSFLEEFKTLKNQMRLLLFNGKPKEHVSEYHKLLSMLDRGDKESRNALATKSQETVHKPKEQLLSHTAVEGRMDSSRFVEYWVPTQISNVQLEQYCATLLSNSLSLCSSSKGDLVGVLHDILVSTRKCCNHPYNVDPSLQGSLMKDLQPIEYLDVGIKASGKLQLLDRLLLESKRQHLKVLILFQSIGGSGRDLTGDILDDFLRQRFGADSYERVDGGILPSKKQAALNKFNDKELGRFVFLLENRACNPSIKLSSVDMVIIFDSDWNPASDLRNLQKLTIESQVQIKVLRFYLSCTVEEKALICAKQGIHLESKLQTISRSNSHMLLMWGASYLMCRLDEFHGSSSLSSMALSDQLLANSVVQEFLALLLQNDNRVKSRSVIVKAQQTSGTYCTDFPLVGETKIQSTAEDLPHIFWTKLLEGKHPCWKYLSGSTPRNRKRVQSNVNILEEVESDSNQLDKKRKKLTNNSVSLSSRKQQIDGEKKDAANKEGTSRPFIKSLRGEDLAAIPEGKMVDSDEGRKLRDAQRSLHLLLKPEISRLSDLLNLSDNIKGMVDIFLDYVINNHHVSREPASILQAFQLALCWTAVSLSKEKIDHTESLELAKQHLNYQCKKEEADHVYLMLRHLKKMFLHLTKNLPVDSLKYGELKDKVLEMEQSGVKSPLPAMPCLQTVKVEIEDCTFQGSSSNEVISSPKFMDEFGLTLRDISESGREIQNQKQILLELERRKNEICREYEAQKVLHENNRQMEAAIVRLHFGDSTKIDRLNRLDRECSTKIEECSREMAMRLKQIEAEYLASANGVQQDTSLVEGDRCSMQVQLLNELPEARHGQESYNCHNQLDNADPLSVPLSDQSVDAIVCAEKDCLLVRIGSDNDEMNAVASGTVSTEVGLCANGIPIDSQGNAISINPCYQENLPVNSQGDFISSHAPEKVSTLNACTLVDQIPDGSRKEAIDEPVPLEAQEIVHLMNLPERSSSPDPQVSETELPNGSESGVVDNAHCNDGPHKVALVNRSMSRMPDGIDKVGAPGHALENVSSLNVCSLDDQILDGSREEALDELPAVETLPEEELRFNCNAASTGMQERNAPDEEQHNVEGASLSSYHTLPDQELGDDFSAPSTSMQERNAPDEEQHNASQQTAFLSSGTNATSSFSGAADMEPPVLPQPPDQPLNHSSHDLALVSGTATPLQGVGETSNLTVHFQSTQVDENPAMPHQAMSESAVSVPRGRMVAQSSGNSTASVSVESNTQLLQSPFLMVQPRTPLKLHSDPLQNELDRMQREMDQMDKAHEDAKMQLVSDCDKEIEEIVAQIRRKYDLKLKEIEAEYLPKKKEFDMNHRKVLMNKMLAEAFKSKWSDIRASGANGIQQDVASGSMQQLLQLSSQRNAHQSLPVRGPSASLQSNRVGTAGTPFTSSESFPPSLASLQNVGPSGVAILNTPVVSSGIASRPPQISLSVPPPSANIQAPSDIRSPAPHLQVFRPSVASSGTPLQGLPNQQPPSNPPPTCTPLQQFPSAAAPPAGPAGPSSWHHGGGSAGGFPPIDLGSDLFMDVPCFRPPIAIRQRDNLTSSNATSDVVCLSDDD